MKAKPRRTKVRTTVRELRADKPTPPVDTTISPDYVPQEVVSVFMDLTMFDKIDIVNVYKTVLREQSELLLNVALSYLASKGAVELVARHVKENITSDFAYTNTSKIDEAFDSALSFLFLREAYKAVHIPEADSKEIILELLKLKNNTPPTSSTPNAAEIAEMVLGVLGNRKPVDPKVKLPKRDDH